MEPIRVFISYSGKDKKMAGEIARVMKSLRMKPFLAHDDIVAGEQWKEAVRKEICECDMLVALVTPNFHKSEYTEQEAGAAWVLEKPILAILTDEEKPTGFIAERQGVQYRHDYPAITVSGILRFVLSEICKDEDMVDTLTELLAEAKSYEAADCVADLLVHEKDLTAEQLDAIKSAMWSSFHAQTSINARIWLDDLFYEHKANGG